MFKIEKTLNIPIEMANVLNDIYKVSKKLNPLLTENDFLLNIINEGLTPYKLTKSECYHKDMVRLRNSIKMAVAYSGKSQTEIAKSIGIDRTYLQKIISGKYEPSVTLALLIFKATGYPKFDEVFYLEPVEG